MKKLVNISFKSILLVFILMSCTSEEENKRLLITYVTKDMCKGIGSDLSESLRTDITGNEDVDKIAHEFLGSLEISIEKFCNCFSDIIGQELQSKFTYKELLEIKNDKIKQIMVGKKILESRDIQVEMQNCLKNTISEKGKEYQNFQNSIDEKFDK
jgi:hypothetical protein